jgi:hypothetical protein
LNISYGLDAILITFLFLILWTFFVRHSVFRRIRRNGLFAADLFLIGSLELNDHKCYLVSSSGSFHRHHFWHNSSEKLFAYFFLKVFKNFFFNFVLKVQKNNKLKVQFKTIFQTIVVLKSNHILCVSLQNICE